MLYPGGFGTGLFFHMHICHTECTLTVHIQCQCAFRTHTKVPDVLCILFSWLKSSVKPREILIIHLLLGDGSSSHVSVKGVEKKSKPIFFLFKAKAEECLWLSSVHGPVLEGQGTTDVAILNRFFSSPPIFIFAQRVSCLIFRHDELCAKSNFAHSCRVSTLSYFGTTRRWVIRASYDFMFLFYFYFYQ